MAKIGAKTYKLVEVKWAESGGMRLRFEAPFNEGRTAITVHLDSQEAKAVGDGEDHMMLVTRPRDQKRVD